MSCFRPIHSVPAASRTLAGRASVLAAVLLFAVASPVAAESPAVAEAPAFKLYIEAPGPYRVSFEDLTAVGLGSEGLPSAGLGVTNEGHPVPVWVEDGGDGIFGPGDWVELIGDLPHGWVSHLNEHTRYNVYFLRFDLADPIRMVSYVPSPVPASEDGHYHAFRRRVHHERDFFVQRSLKSHDDRPAELWYWAKLSHIDREPLTHPLHLGDLDLSTGGTVDLRVEFRGWSQPEHKPTPEMADHRIEVFLNGAELATAEWNGKESFQLKIPDVPAKRFVKGENALAFKVPKRAAGAPDDWLIDVIMLNWIEITYPRIGEVGGSWGGDFTLNEPLAARPMRLLAFKGAGFVLYGLNGSRMTSDALPAQPEGSFIAHVFAPPPGESSFVPIGTSAFASPKAIVLERPSRLADAGNQADYIMISHRRLIEAIQPLAELHRSRGLAVEVVDLQDVYDEFADGIAQPSAVRDFLEHAYYRWRPPAPRFVLLVGDASWNGKDVFIGDGSFPDHLEEAPAPPVERFEPDADTVQFTPYAQDTDLVNRQLVPTWDQLTIFGHAASDNYFVAVDGDDTLPDMAIGRLAVVEPADVTSIVEKTIRYASKPEVGPWRRSIVFLTNTLKRFHNQSRSVAKVFNAEGFSTEEIYPTLEEPDNAQYTRRLIELLNEGQLFIHYLGHGGRYIWETGRRDLKENRDLFTFEDLENLEATSRLPVVLSLTCYSAPYDHPEADSLGEKMLRIADRGAIAVVAASWTNGPTGTWGKILMEELTRPGATVGEAFMRAKHRNPTPQFVDLYSLLGDPAVPVAAPVAEIDLSISGGEGAALTVSGTMDVSEFSGELLVELVDGERQTLHEVTTPLEGPEFTVELEVTAEELAAASVARVYAWDVSRGIDAAAAVELPGKEARPERPRPPRRRRMPPEEPAEPIPQATAGEILADTVAWWSFDEAAGSEVHDRLDAHHGSLVGRAVRSDGPRGGAFDFHGQGFIDFGSDQLNVGSGDFAIQAWIATRQAREKLWVILDKRTNVGYHLYNHMGRLGLQIADGQFSNYTGPFIADGRWHHVVVSVDRDLSDGILWYVDGKEAVAPQDPTPRRGSLDNPSPLYVGGRRFGGGGLVGELDELAIFRRALSSLDVENLYKGGWDWLAGAAPAGQPPSSPAGDSSSSRSKE